jgi:hypothetical protein
MRNLILGVLLLIGTAANAAESSNLTSPLPPGKPAGVKAAQRWYDDNTAWIVMGAAAVGIGIALAVSNDDNGTAPPVVTSGTSP